jgi:alpha-galactosidase/6-phospho-beta-glucosidase family protein
MATGKTIDKKSEFVDSLNHLSWIVQIRQLKQRRRNEIEELLSIFDQENVSNHRHILEIDETKYPKKFRPLVRKLIEASASKEVRENMQLEDDYLSELLIKDELYAAAEAAREAAEARETAEKVAKEAAQAELQIAKTQIADKDQALADKDQALANQAAELQKYKALLIKSGINL